MSKIAEYRKGIVAGLAAIVQIGALFYPPIAELLGPEVIAGIAGILCTIFVVQLPNDPPADAPQKVAGPPVRSPVIVGIVAVLLALALSGCAGQTIDAVKDVIIGKEGPERCARAQAAHAAALELPQNAERDKRIRLYQAAIDINCAVEPPAAAAGAGG